MDEVLLAVLEDFRFRVVHRPRFQCQQLAENDHFVAHGKVLLHVRQVPPAAVQPGRPVIENQLKDRLGVLREPLHPQGNDGASRRRRLVELQLGNWPELAAILVAVRPMQEQVFDGANLQPCQLHRAFRADTGQRGHGSGKGQGRLIGRCGSHPPAPYNAHSAIRSPKSNPSPGWAPMDATTLADSRANRNAADVSRLRRLTAPVPRTVLPYRANR